MANRTFTMTIADFNMNDALGSDAGSASAGTVVVDVAESATRAEVVVALHALADKIAANQETLN